MQDQKTVEENKTHVAMLLVFLDSAMNLPVSLHIIALCPDLMMFSCFYLLPFVLFYSCPVLV